MTCFLAAASGYYGIESPLPYTRNLKLELFFFNSLSVRI